MGLEHGKGEEGAEGRSAGGEGAERRSTLTFPQTVLEVRVIASFPVKINAVTD